VEGQRKAVNRVACSKCGPDLPCRAWCPKLAVSAVSIRRWLIRPPAHQPPFILPYISYSGCSGYVNPPYACNNYPKGPKSPAKVSFAAFLVRQLLWDVAEGAGFFFVFLRFPPKKRFDSQPVRVKIVAVFSAPQGGRQAQVF